LDNFIPVESLPLAVGFPGELHDPSEFVTPKQVMVRNKLQEICGDSRGDDAIIALWYYSCSLKYPMTKSGIPTDYHRLEAFEHTLDYLPGLGIRVRPQVVLETGKDGADYWQPPHMTIRLQGGDCEDRSSVLVSLLRNFILPDEVFVAVGAFNSHMEMNHAWGVLGKPGRGFIMETTAPGPEGWVREEALRERYRPLLYYNDRMMLIHPSLEGIGDPVFLTRILCPVSANEGEKIANIRQLWGEISNGRAPARLL